tara:strand:- start:21465 stop:22136 length:672 start_codon:yes stop_codon:yes gene_type:complete
MKNFKTVFLIILLISSNLLYAATATPTAYKTTVTKFELCSSSDCSDPVVLGSATKQFDIASKSVGTDVGTYLNDFTITLGRTYTHARSTINSTFQVQGTVDVSGTTCNTVASPSNTAASATATAKTAADGTLADMAWMVPNANGGGDYSDLRSTYTANGIAKTDGASTFTFTVALAVPYTPKATDSPKILIKFNVADTLIAVLGSGLCVIYVDPPVQTVTIMR